jgi:hypothetical protein
LNLPLATVQKALATPAINLPKPSDPIAGAATALGVTEQQLTSAVQAADQAIGVGGATGSVTCSQPDPTTFFAGVARQLGSAFTGQQVQSAFASSAPKPPDMGQIQGLVQQQLSNLAAALGVSVSALTAALSSSGIPNGCLPITGGVVGAGNAQPPTGGAPGSGSIVIPVASTGSPSGSNGGGDALFVTARASGSSGQPGTGVICVQSPVSS